MAEFEEQIMQDTHTHTFRHGVGLCFMAPAFSHMTGQQGRGCK